MVELPPPDDDLAVPDPPDRAALAAAYMALYRALRTCSHVGYPARIVERIREWMDNPRPGDLVVVDMVGRRSAEEVIGEYVASWSHLFPPGDPALYDGRAPAHDGHYEVYGVVGLDGAFSKWGNCRLVRVPRDEGELREALDEDRVRRSFADVTARAR